MTNSAALPALPRWASLLPLIGALAACSAKAADPTPVHWAGNTYVLTIPTNNWTKPSKDVGGEIGDFVPPFMIGIAGSDSSPTITLGTAPNNVQDACNPTTQVTATAAYPNSQIVAPSFPARIMDWIAASGDAGMGDAGAPPLSVRTTIHDFTLTNVLPADDPTTNRDLLATSTLTATLDVAELYPLFTKVPPSMAGAGVTKDDVCNALEAFAPGAGCTTCAFNGQPYCLTLQAVQLGAVKTATPIRAIAAADIPASCP